MGLLDFIKGIREERESVPNLNRNDPCWCGSGKKYKYCHMLRDERRRARTKAFTCKSAG